MNPSCGPILMGQQALRVFRNVQDLSKVIKYQAFIIAHYCFLLLLIAPTNLKKFKG
jgi:hypothetical protein